MNNQNKYDVFDDEAIPIKRRPKTASGGSRPRPQTSQSAPRQTLPRPERITRPTGAASQSASSAPRTYTPARTAAPKQTRTAARTVPVAKPYRPAEQPDSDIAVRKTRPGIKSFEKKPKKKSVFKKAFLIYIGVLLLISVVFLIYVHGLLVDFEASQVENVISSKLGKIKSAAAIGNLESEMSLDEIKTKYSPSSQELSDYQSAFAKGELTFKKTRSGLSTDSETYELYLNGFAIGKLTAKTVKEEMVLAIFPVTEWVIDSCRAETFSFDFPASVTVTSGGKTVEGKPSETEGLYSYTVSSLFGSDTVITDSAGNSAAFNGKDKISFTNYTVKVLSTYSVYSGDRLIEPSKGTVEKIEDFEYVREYCPTVPDYVNYKLCLIGKSDIKIKDASGADVTFKQEENEISAIEFESSNTLPDGILGDPDPLDVAEKWSLIMSADLRGGNNGFQTLAPHLIKDSEYYKYMWKWVNSIDYTFISDHTLENPVFELEEVSDYIMYAPNCFSCRIKLDKPMHLANGNRYVDKIDSVFYFVYFDDSDDGVNNPHWAVVDRR